VDNFFVISSRYSVTHETASSEKEMRLCSILLSLASFNSALILSLSSLSCDIHDTVFIFLSSTPNPTNLHQ